jgi:hypothetical protein
MTSIKALGFAPEARVSPGWNHLADYGILPRLKARGEVLTTAFQLKMIGEM